MLLRSTSPYSQRADK